MDEIRMIPIGKLWPHPDNPRKELGDLTELAESIKVNGVLQNLTVVPWFSEVTWAPCDDPKAQKEMGYRIVIGHRRHAAAKLAGLTELPCIIREMHHDEQVRTMLIENMQRSDLSCYEQAQGFQMMMNMGDSIEDIARKSGFSQTTVRRRVKLLELDQDKFKKSVERGATLMDYAELDKINDPELKNKVLDYIGTKNFRQQLQRAIDQEKNDAYLEQANEFVSGFATELTEVDRAIYEYAGSYAWWRKREFEKPKDADSTSYFFHVSKDCVELYRKRVTSAPTEEELLKQAQREDFARREAALEDAETRARTLRFDFVAGFTRSKSCAAIIDKWLTRALIYNGEPKNKLLCDLLQCKQDQETETVPTDVFAEEYESRPNYVRLCAAYATLDQGPWGRHLSYLGRQWDSKTQRYYLIHGTEDDLDTVYKFLAELGYEMSDEEKSLQDGTHELFEEVPEDVRDD